MKTPTIKKMTEKQCEKEFLRLQGLNDGKEYCMTYNIYKGWRVGEKTEEQKKIDASNPKIANMKVADFVKNYDITADLH